MNTLPRSRRARATSFFAGSTGEATKRFVAERLTSRHGRAGNLPGVYTGSHVAPSRSRDYCMPAHGVRPGVLASGHGRRLGGAHAEKRSAPRAHCDPVKRGRYGFDGGCEVLVACPSARDDVNTSGNVIANDNAYALAA